MILANNLPGNLLYSFFKNKHIFLNWAIHTTKLKTPQVFFKCMWILSINGPQDQTKAEVDPSSWWNGTELPIVLPRWWNLHLNRQLDKRLVSKSTEWRPQWSVSLGYVIGKIKSERMDKSAIQSLQQNTKHLWEGRWRFFSFSIEMRAPNVFPKNM